MTPPFGYNLFLMRAMAPKCQIQEKLLHFDLTNSVIKFLLPGLKASCQRVSTIEMHDGSRT